MSLTLDVAIEPAIPDNTAFTVLRTLRKLGYEELLGVSRADHLLLMVGQSDGAGLTPLRVAEALSKAEVLFNPSKHRLAYASAGAATPDAGAEYEALVSDKDDDARRLLSLLRTTFGMDYLESVERGVVWQLHERDRAAPAERLQWACRMLLSNAVSQVYQVRARPKRIILRSLGQSVGEQNEGTAKELR